MMLIIFGRKGIKSIVSSDPKVAESDQFEPAFMQL